MPKNERGRETNDQRINSKGRGRLLSVTKYLPSDFEWVRVTKTKAEDNSVWLRIDKLELRQASE